MHTPLTAKEVTEGAGEMFQQMVLIDLNDALQRTQTEALITAKISLEKRRI